METLEEKYKNNSDLINCLDASEWVELLKEITLLYLPFPKDEEIEAVKNIKNISLNSTTQYVVDSLNEFLDKATLLNGFYYTKNMVFNGIEIKPGMVITTSDDINYIAFPTVKGIAFTNNSLGGWTFLLPKDIIRIHDLTVGEFIDSGKILWEKPKKVVLTKQQIAEKFNIDVENLIIE